MKIPKLTKLALAVAFTGGALASCDSGYDTKAVKTDSATPKPQGDFVVADMKGNSAQGSFQVAQYQDDDQYQDSEDSSDDSYLPENELDEEDDVASVEERRPGSDGNIGDVGDYSFRSDADQTVRFEFDSDELTDEGKDQLKRFVETMNQDSLASVEVSITGYTDQEGSEEYNKDLAKRRAEAVKNFLEEQGLASYNLKIDAVGEPENESLAENAQDNRRVVVSVEAPYDDEVS